MTSWRLAPCRPLIVTPQPPNQLTSPEKFRSIAGSTPLVSNAVSALAGLELPQCNLGIFVAVAAGGERAVDEASEPYC